MQSAHNTTTRTHPWLGCIADDYTGATDLASFLVQTGLRTIQINGLPNHNHLSEIQNVDAVVIALKSRAIPANEAVDISEKAFDSLLNAGCEKFYFKYCSTFDSTCKGNIGPVVDALMKKAKVHSTLLCPALPVNGRTVYNGHLFVFEQLLHESPMRSHPINPMRDSSLARLIEKQGQGKAKVINYQTLIKGEDEVLLRITEAQKNHQYIIVDTLANSDFDILGKAVKTFKLVTGGSGLALSLKHDFIENGGQICCADSHLSPIKGPTIVLSGSCSAMTQKQVNTYKKRAPSHYINIEDMLQNKDFTSNLCEWLSKVFQDAPIIYTTSDDKQIDAIKQTFPNDDIAQKIEHCFMDIARYCQQTLGVKNFIVAGGETSGAVVNALGLDSFYIGKTISPGVPMIQSTGKQGLNLALKSGNFGDSDFFSKAVETLRC